MPVAALTWWPAVAGLAVGVLLFLPWKAGAAGQRMAKDTYMALRAVALPLLVVAVVGALTTPKPLIQLIVGVLAAAIVVPWIGEREWRQTFRPLARVADTDRVSAVRTEERQVLGSGLVFLVVGLVVFAIQLAVQSPDFDNRGGLPTALALTAIYLLLGATVARLLGFASTWMRWVVAVAAVLVLLRALLAVGVFGVFTWKADSWPKLSHSLVIFAGIFGLCALIESVLAERGHTQSTRPVPSKVSRYGLGLALASSLFIGVALLVGAIEVRRSSATFGAGLERASLDQSGLNRQSDSQLALTFLPVLHFHEDSQWTPEPVDDYLKRAWRVGDSSDTRFTLASLPRDCGDFGTDPCHALTIGCPAAANDCSATRPEAKREGRQQDGAVYVRVIRKDKPRRGERIPFEAFGPKDLHKDLSILVQYWFFYDYDEWVAPVLGGRIVQRHEGDWEAVTVGLSDEEPLFVGFSEHCGGIWQRWNPRESGRESPIRVADTTTVPSIAVENAEPGDAGPWEDARGLMTHPAVFVAVGSQANYPPALANRAPDWSTCQGFSHEAVDLLSYVSNIRDRTGKGFTWMPSTLELVHAGTPPMTFPGTWGAKDTMQYVTRFDDPDKKGGRGPRTPSRQDLWVRTVFQIFCGEAWRSGDGERAYRRKCAT